MSYIGNSPDVNAFTIGVERFSGTGACTQFTLTRDIDDAKAIEVVVGGSQLDPLSAYTVTDGLITFTVAPTAGTDNIVVTYGAPIVITFNQVTASQIQANAVTTTAIADGAITSSKIADGTVIAVDIADGSVTGRKLDQSSVSGNNIGTNAISSNNISLGAITGNLIATSVVAGNNIIPGTITGNLIADFAISANNLANPDNFEDMFFLGGM